MLCLAGKGTCAADLPGWPQCLLSPFILQCLLFPVSCSRKLTRSLCWDASQMQDGESPQSGLLAWVSKTKQERGEETVWVRNVLQVWEEQGKDRARFELQNPNLGRLYHLPIITLFQYNVLSCKISPLFFKENRFHIKQFKHKASYEMLSLLDCYTGLPGSGNPCLYGPLHVLKKESS